MRRLAAVAAATACLVGGLVGGHGAPASAGSERMQLLCEDSRVLERSNGSSWWGVDHAAGYVSEQLTISEGGDVVFAKHYGDKGPDAERSTCVADHFGSTWTVALVRTR